MQDLWHQIKKQSWLVKVNLIIICVFIIIIFLFLYILHYENQNTFSIDSIPLETPVESVEDVEIEASIENEIIYVDIKGGVKYPNVYALPQGSRLFDLIDKAGGFLEDAAFDKVNLAQLLDDQMMIYIYREGELESNSENTESSTLNNSEMEPLIIQTQAADTQSHLININTASSIELETLPNIGPKKAQAIIQYRSDYGSFQSIEEIMEVSGIGLKTYEELNSLITVN